MKRLFGRITICVLAIVLCASIAACAAGAVSTTLILRASKVTQNAVINVGEDLSMEVLLEGAEPDAYQWYFNNEPISGSNQKIYNIVDASVADSGIYRLDAFDANGKMIVSMDINARVIDPEVPKSGDNSMPIEIAIGTFVLAGAALLLTNRRKATR